MQENAEDGTLALTSLKTSVLQISEALSLRYEKAGNGPPLLLLHTIRAPLKYFHGLASVLAGSHSVHVIDLPGHSGSPINSLPIFDEPFFRRAVIGFIEKLELVNVTLVGESIGGALALSIAAEISHRIGHVFAVNLHDFHTHHGDSRRTSRFANLIIGSLQSTNVGSSNAWMEAQTEAPAITGAANHDPQGELPTEFSNVAEWPGYKRKARGVLADWRSWSKARSRYHMVSTPVTLIYGEDDWSRPDERERTQALLPGARMFTLKDTGHFSALENPLELARIIAETSG